MSNTNVFRLIDADKGEYAFVCPACDCWHSITTLKKNNVGAQWKFNGDLLKPTVSPSVHIKIKKPQGDTYTCHLFIRDGRIEYLKDCTHDKRDSTILMEPID